MSAEAAGIEGAGFVVRPAMVEDVPAAARLYAEVAAEERWIGGQPPVDREQREARLHRALGDDRQAVFVADSGGEVIGQVGIELAPYGVASLGMLVAGPWRGRGVGSALLEAAIRWAGDAGAHKLALQVWPHNRPARALYEKFGFVTEGILRRHYPRRNGELWDAVVMGLVLDESRPGCSIE